MNPAPPARTDRERCDLLCAHFKFNSNFVDDSLDFRLFLHICKMFWTAPDRLTQGFCCAACIPLRGREDTSPSEKALNGVLERNENSTYFGISTRWHLWAHMKICGGAGFRCLSFSTRGWRGGLGRAREGEVAEKVPPTSMSDRGVQR